MGSGRSLVFLSHILINVVGLGISQPDFLFYNCSEGFGNYTINSVYQTNLNTLLSSISSDTDSYGFNSSSFGESPDRVNAIALCRGDIDLDTCRGCINDATSNITQVCPNNNKEFFGGYDLCMVQYSNESINGITTLFPSVCMFSPEKASNANPFNQALRTLLDRLSSQAASGGTRRKFATGNVTVQVNQTIYGLMQCTPNLSEEDCSNCLSSNIGYFSTLAGDSLGGRFIAPSCNLRYEIWLFFGENSTGAPSGIAPSGIGPSDIAPSGIAPSGRYVKRKRTVIVVVISTITSAVAVIVCVLILSWKCKRRMPRDEVVVSEAADKISTLESLQHNFVTLKNATENFSDDNKLGKGGFGVVYKGRLKNGQEIAVKRLSVNSGQGEVEFKNEAMLVARLQHRNLVRLLGFCLEGKERLLIYELVTNSSLDQYIFDPIKSSLLDWDRRYKIIGGIARGLLYLHEDSRLRIIHRDLKASNVLLDAEMNPKISDFGMARLFVLDETEGNTNRIVGTFGYMAPEYAMHGHFSIKSDVFSFGVLVLEIITGQKNSYFQKGENGENLLSFAWKSWLEGKGSNLIDPTLETNSDSICEIERCFHIGLLCVQESIGNRPTMSSVVQMLKTSSFTLSMPSEPAFFPRSNIDPQNSVFLESVDDASITGCYPR